MNTTINMPKMHWLECTKYLHFAEKRLTYEDYYNSLGGPHREFRCKSFEEWSGLAEGEIDDCNQKFLKRGWLADHEGSTWWWHVSDKNAIKFFIKHTKKNYFLREEPLLSREEIVLIALGIKKSQGFFEKDSITKIKRTFGTSDEVLTLSLRDILFRLSYAEESLTDSLVSFTTALAEFLNPTYYQLAYVDARRDLHLHITQIIKPTLKSDPKFKYDWETASAKYIETESGKLPKLKIKLSLKDRTVEFDDSKPAIIVDGKSCPLPPAKNECYLARAIFNRPVGEYVDWSIIYKEMSGDTEVIGEPKNQKTVRDTVNRLNKRIKEIIGTDDELLSWENKSIRRNY